VPFRLPAACFVPQSIWRISIKFGIERSTKKNSISWLFVYVFPVQVIIYMKLKAELYLMLNRLLYKNWQVITA
jgi:hypothetical protein